ncbi:isoleucine--tRNA ligase, mitochondrial [Drosophila tropicalis]|uniref:isoleucine--tRNA ligase, mitochondrial n=2 Tax=Drosophila tropicalis TaxID=46794 RepID=UPI0035ABB2A6
MLRAFNVRLGLRLYCVKAAKKDVKRYTDTINLPKTKFPNRLSAAKREEQERQILNNQIASAYEYQERRNLTDEKPTFVLHDGPPYANGQLHMGHAVNKILKDITLRQRVAHGQKVNYIPGWDCHGLPIELKATNASGVGSVADPLDVRQKSRKFALEAVQSQKDEFRSWGILADWQRDQIYMTFQPEFIANQLKMFYDLYERGLVYRDLKPVYWSPSSRTALAEAELEYDAKHISPSVYLRFKLNPHAGFKSIYALVWTTTPWTLPSNQAICFNSSLDYVLIKLTDRDPNNLYLIAAALVTEFEAATQLKCEIVHKFDGSLLNQLSYHHPIDREQTQLPFFDAKHVQDNKGTGLVHTAPAHGPDDFLICLSKKIPVKCFVDESGIYTKEAPDFLVGQSVLGQGNSLVLQHIAQDVVKATQLEHSYPIDWRTKEPVIVRASEQWFINTEKLKGPAAAALDQVEVYPKVNAEASKKALLNQLQKRPYWCISRQRAWGVPIPVLYRRDTGKVMVNRALIDHLCARLKSEGNMDFWWSQTLDDKLLPAEIVEGINCDLDLIVKGKDIFDIWFDSGSTWSAVLQGEQVADLYLEGYDQFTGWFQSSLLTSVAARNTAPYKALFVHGFTVDEKGHKMSKSLGNVISPKQITKKYGTDVLRWWVASHGTQNMSITVSDKLLQQSADNLSKVRGILRYLNGVIGEKQKLTQHQEDESYLNKYLLSNLLDFDAEIENLYNNYEYNRVVASIQNFIVNQVSAIYVHLIKDRLYCGNSGELAAIRQTLTHCYRHLCKTLWPIVPFLVEESWRHYEPQSDGFHTDFILADPNWRNAKSVQIVNAALDIKRLLNQQSGDANTWLLDVTVQCANPKQHELLKELQNSELCEILQVGTVSLQQPIDVELCQEAKVNLKMLNSTLCPRCRRYSLQPNDHETCFRCSLVLKATES